jgi:hypothetical protein
MKVIRPAFCEGVEWRKLTPEERDGKPWKYVLLKDVFIQVETGLTRHFNCCGENGVIWMMILPHGIRMMKGYAWNGNTASPDRLLGRWLLLESLPHDGLFQFSGAAGFPRDVITLNFANCLYFALAPPFSGWAYYSGLTLGSWALWGRPPKNGDYVESLPLFLPEPT